MKETRLPLCVENTRERAAVKSVAEHACRRIELPTGSSKEEHLEIKPGARKGSQADGIGSRKLGEQ